MGKPSLPTRQIFPIPPPNGTVHTSEPIAFQFAVMMGDEVRYRPPGRAWKGTSYSPPVKHKVRS